MSTTYLVETTINPGVQYQVDQAEYEQLLELGLLVNGPAEPAPGVFDTEVAAVVTDPDSQTHAAVAALAGTGGGGAVDSVNGQTGVVVLDAADVGAVSSVNGSTGAVILDAADVGADVSGSAAAAQAFAIQRANHTGTQASTTLSDLTETVQDIVAALIAAGTGIAKTYDDTTGTLTITATGGAGGATDPEVVRDTIGSALVQGSGITITVNDAGDTITIASTAVLPTRQVNSGTGLTGGGDLSANRTLAVSYGSAAGTSVQGNDARVTADQAAATASIRTLGTGANQAAAGDHTHSTAQVEGVVFHDGTAGGGPRPSGYARVRWVNPEGTSYSRPTNMAAGDVWEHDA